MRYIFGQIKAFNQPAKFGQSAGFCEPAFLPWPGEFVTLQTLLPQAKSVAMPVQRFDLVVVPVGENVQRAGKGAQAQLLLNKHAQGVDGFSEVNGFQPATVALAVQVFPGACHRTRPGCSAWVLLA